MHTRFTFGSRKSTDKFPAGEDGFRYTSLNHSHPFDVKGTSAQQSTDRTRTSSLPAHEDGFRCTSSSSVPAWPLSLKAPKHTEMLGWASTRKDGQEDSPSVQIRRVHFARIWLDAHVRDVYPHLCSPVSIFTFRSSPTTPALRFSSIIACVLVQSQRQPKNHTNHAWFYSYMAIFWPGELDRSSCYTFVAEKKGSGYTIMSAKLYCCFSEIPSGASCPTCYDR